MKTSKFNFIRALLLFGLIPCVTSVLVISIISVSRLSNNLKEEVKESLQIAATSLCKFEENELAATGEIVANYDYIDSLKSKNIEKQVYSGQTISASDSTSEVDEQNSEIETGESFDGENIQSLNKLAYKSSYNNVKNSEGGSYGISYYTVVIDNEMTIYRVNFDTTGGNGATVKVACDISDEQLDKLNDYVNKEKWKKLFDTTSELFNSNKMEYVSGGMNDNESRNEDGSYKWKDDFNNLVNK